MKKIKYLIFAFLLIIPLSVYAAEKPRVLTLSTSSTDMTISYAGSVEADSHAVMCKLYDSSNTELKKLSSAVDNHVFNGEFTVTTPGTYKVACANYEGGIIKEAEAVVAAPSEEIKELTLKFTKPEIGAKIEKDDDNMPTLMPTITSDNEAVTVGAYFISAEASDEAPEQDLLFGTLEEGKKYYLIIDLYIGPEYADTTLASDLKVNIEGLDDFTVSAGGSEKYKNVYASFELTKEEQQQTEEENKESPNTGDKIINYVIILSVGIIGTLLGVIYFKRNLSKKSN